MKRDLWRERLLGRWLREGGAPQPSRDAHALVEMVVAQRLAAPFERALVADDWPPGALERVRRVHRVSLVRGAVQLELAARVLALLAKQRVRALPLKGAALAERLYDGPGERPMDDVDLYVVGDFAAADAVMTRAGFVVRERADHATSYLDRQTGEVIELHAAIASCAPLFSVDAEGVWRRSRPGPPRRPSSEDLAIQLSLHAAFQHGFAITLGQYLDFRRLFEREPPDTEALIALAEASGTVACVYAALEVARAVVAAPLPEPLRQGLERRAPARLRRWLATALRDSDALVATGTRSLVRVRWELAAGQTARLVRHTVAPAHLHGVAPTLGRLAHLGRRWVLKRP